MKSAIWRWLTFEKIVLGLVVILILVTSVSAHRCRLILEQNGGVRQVLVDVGKDVKSIIREINE